MALKRKNLHEQEGRLLSHTHAALTADLETKLWAPDRKFLVTRVQYVNPTGLTEDAANFFALSVRKNAADTVASWSTETGQEGTLAADTFVEFTDGAAADMVLDAGDELSFFADESGTQTLPAGTVLIEGCYLQ